MLVLVVEDDPGMASLLDRALADEGYRVDLAGTGQDALFRATETTYDAVVLDVMIPEPDGFEVLRRLRAAGCWSPVLMLTARGDTADRVRGLDSGADDYLVKPFVLDELSARLRSLTRRVSRERPTILSVGDLQLDPAARTVHRAGQPIGLTAQEFRLLAELMRHSGEVLSRTQLLDGVWDGGSAGNSNIVDVYIRHLRDKVDRPFGSDSIQTLRGAGYRISEP